MKPSVVVNLGKNERCITVGELVNRIANSSLPKNTRDDSKEPPNRYISRYIADLDRERERHASVSVKTLARIAEIVGTPADLDTPLELSVLASYECRHDDVVFIQAKRYEGHKTLYEQALEKAVSEYEHIEHGGVAGANEAQDSPADMETTATGTPPDAASDDVASATDVETGDRAAPLKIGVNDKASVHAYIARRAREIYAAGELLTGTAISKFIASEMQEKGYRSERGGYLSPDTVYKAIPDGMTGGRAKNGRNARKIESVR